MPAGERCDERPAPDSCQASKTLPIDRAESLREQRDKLAIHTQRNSTPNRSAPSARRASPAQSSATQNIETGVGPGPECRERTQHRSCIAIEPDVGLSIAQSPAAFPESAQ